MSIIANKTVLSRIQLIGTGMPPVQIKRVISQIDASSQAVAAAAAAGTGSASVISSAAQPVDPSTQLSPIITSCTAVPPLNAHRLANEPKQPIKVGKYTLHELQACDSYNTAISNSDNTQFYWKVCKTPNFIGSKNIKQRSFFVSQIRLFRNSRRNHT